MSVVIKKPLAPGTSSDDYEVFSEEEWERKIRENQEERERLIRSLEVESRSGYKRAA